MGANTVNPNIAGAVFQKNRDYSVIEFTKAYCNLRVFYGCPIMEGARRVQTIVWVLIHIQPVYIHYYTVYIIYHDRHRQYVCLSFYYMLPPLYWDAAHLEKEKTH